MTRVEGVPFVLLSAWRLKMKSKFKNLHSLLAGSGAVLMTIGGAQAADAIIVEPEPVEYVRVCDMYGAGFFYIPGSETCLQINGEVSVEYVSFHHHGEDDGTSNHEASVTGQIGFVASNETEYGTLTSDIILAFYRGSSKDEFSQTEGYHTNSGGESGLVKATINIAGFRAGYDADGGGAWNRYAGEGYYDAIIDGLYSFHTAMFFEYGGSISDFNYVVGIQDAVQTGTPGAPDVYAGFNWAVGDLTLGAAVVHDSNGGSDVNGGDGGIAWRVRGDIELESVMPGLGFGAWYESDDGRTDYVKGHVWGVTAKAGLTDKVSAYGGFSRYDGLRTASGTDASTWTGGLLWAPVDGLEVQAEYSAFWSEENGGNGGAFALGITRSF